MHRCTRDAQRRDRPPLPQAFVIIPRTLKFVYYVLITSAFCANILVVSQTTIISVLGASLALRGPDGSMMTATDGLYDERGTIFKAFGHGLVLTIGSVVMAVWLHLHWEASLVCCAMAVLTIARMVRIHPLFHLHRGICISISCWFSICKTATDLLSHREEV